MVAVVPKQRCWDGSTVPCNITWLGVCGLLGYVTLWVTIWTLCLMYFQCSILNHRARPVIGLLMQQIPQWQTWKTHISQAIQSKLGQQHIRTNMKVCSLTDFWYLCFRGWNPEVGAGISKRFSKRNMVRVMVFFYAPIRPHRRFAHLSLSPSDLPLATGLSLRSLQLDQVTPKNGRFIIP